MENVNRSEEDDKSCWRLVLGWDHSLFAYGRMGKMDEQNDTGGIRRKAREKGKRKDDTVYI